MSCFSTTRILVVNYMNEVKASIVTWLVRWTLARWTISCCTVWLNPCRAARWSDVLPTCSNTGTGKGKWYPIIIVLSQLRDTGAAIIPVFSAHLTTLWPFTGPVHIWRPSGQGQGDRSQKGRKFLFRNVKLRSAITAVRSYIEPWCLRGFSVRRIEWCGRHICRVTARNSMHAFAGGPALD